MTVILQSPSNYEVEMIVRLVSIWLWSCNDCYTVSYWLWTCSECYSSVPVSGYDFAV